MSIWGHKEVKIEKNVEKKCWYVRTLQGSALCTVNWTDVFRDIKNAPDYALALATCTQAAPLTIKEERLAYQDFLAATKTQTKTETKPADNVVRVDFKTKQRRP